MKNGIARQVVTDLVEAEKVLDAMVEKHHWGQGINGNFENVVSIAALIAAERRAKNGG